MGHPNVSVIGLGKMGSAIAACFLDNKFSTSVWNRSIEKANDLSPAVTVATSPAAACAASDLVVLCVADYAVSRTILNEDGVAAALQGKTLVQISSGTPNDARELQQWATSCKIAYLDAAILNYPAGVGNAGTVIFYSGDQSQFSKHEATLRCLGGNTRFVGERVGAAAAIDCALLGYYYAASAGMLHAAALCEAEEYPMADFFDALKTLTPLLTHTADAAAAMIESSDFSGQQCALDTHLAAMRNVDRAGRDGGVATGIPQSLVTSFADAIKAGHGNDELPAVFNALSNRQQK